MTLSEFIAEQGRPLTASAGDHLFRQGDKNTSLYVVKTGLLKAYYLDEEGKESIKSFLLPGDSIGSLVACYAGESCTFSLICLKACELTALPFDALYTATQSDPEISGAVVNFLLKFGMKKENREYELLCLTPEARYRRLLETTPDLLNLVTQNEIARYLGITPVGLSRIKKRVAEGEPA